MAGVDLMDWKKVTYQFDHRSKYKYYLRVVKGMIDVEVVNAEIMHNKVCNPSDKLDSKNYRSAIAQALNRLLQQSKDEANSSFDEANAGVRTCFVEQLQRLDLKGLIWCAENSTLLCSLNS